MIGEEDELLDVANALLSLATGTPSKEPPPSRSEAPKEGLPVDSADLEEWYRQALSIRTRYDEAGSRVPTRPCPSKKDLLRIDRAMAQRKGASTNGDFVCIYWWRVRAMVRPIGMN